MFKKTFLLNQKEHWTLLFHFFIVQCLLFHINELSFVMNIFK